MSRGARMTVDHIPLKYQNQVAAQLYANPAPASNRRKAQGAVAERSLRDAPPGAPRGEAAYTGRVRVGITSVRRRLIDPDNLCPKYFIDCLRYAGLIRDDSPGEVEIQTAQRLPAPGEEEHTLIDIVPL